MQRKEGSRLPKGRWEQGGVDLAGPRAVALAETGEVGVGGN